MSFTCPKCSTEFSLVEISKPVENDPHDPPVVIPPVVIPPVVLPPVIPPVPSTKRAPILIWNLAYDAVAKKTTAYDGTLRGYGSDLIKALPEMSRLGQHAIITLSRSGSKAGGQLDVAAASKEISTWDQNILAPYFADGTLLPPMIGDDITATEWGPKAPYLDRYDAIAEYVFKRFGVASWIRARPGQLSGRAWVNPIIAGAQYSYSKGEVHKFLAENLAAAKALGIPVWFGLNLLDGGSGILLAGEKQIYGTYVDHFQMKGREIEEYGSVLMPHSDVFPMWRYSGPGYDGPKPGYTVHETKPVDRIVSSAEILAGISAMEGRPDVQAAWAVLKSLPRAV